MKDAILLVATTPTVVRGERIEEGQQVELSPLEAMDAIESRRLRLVHHGDLQRCLEARRKEIARLLRYAPAAPDGPWRPMVH
jgi:hypothetical protein